MARPTLHRPAQLGAIAAVVLVGMLVARHHPDSATAAESAYLALLGAWVLVGLSVSPRTALPVTFAGTLVTALLLMPGAEGTRGAAMLAVLVAAAVWASWRLLGGVASGRAALAPIDALALALAWQAILRSDRFVDPSADVATLVWLVGLPIALAISAQVAARRLSGSAATIAAGTLLPLVPGVGTAPTALLALAALLVGRELDELRRPAVVVPAVVLLAVVGWRSPELLGPTVIVVAALLLQPTTWRWWPVVAAVGWGAIVLMRATADSGSTANALWFAIALPGLWAVAATWRPVALTGLLLAIVAPSSAALAPAAVLAAFAIGASRRVAGGQAAWSLGTLAVAALAAAYPWWRLPVELPGQVLAVPWWLAILVLAAIALAVESVRGRQALVGAAVVAMLALGGGRRSVLEEPTTLTASEAAWQGAIDGEAVTEIVLDTLLTAHTPPGTPVATLLLRRGDGTAVDWELESGRDTSWFGEATLRPWLTWIAAQRRPVRRFRARWRPPTGADWTAIELERSATLPAEVDLVVLAVTLR